MCLGRFGRVFSLFSLECILLYAISRSNNYTNVAFKELYSLSSHKTVTLTPTIRGAGLMFIRVQFFHHLTEQNKIHALLNNTLVFKKLIRFHYKISTKVYLQCTVTYTFRVVCWRRRRDFIGKLSS